jgi:hypothetical protein
MAKEYKMHLVKSFHYIKKIVFCNEPCNSIFELHKTFATHYIYMLWMVIDKLQLIIYVMQLITTQLQFYQNKSFSIIMQLHYNYTHDVMLTSLILIHLLKFSMWHYEYF